MKRQEANLQILETLRAYAYIYPDARFYQLLSILDITKNEMVGDKPVESPNTGGPVLEDLYHVESVEILKRVQFANHKLAIERWSKRTVRCVKRPQPR